MRVALTIDTEQRSRPAVADNALRQLDVLLREGVRVTLETSGAHPVAHLPPAVIRIVDIKTPGSGEVERNFWSVLHGLRPQDAIKFVLCDEADYLWSAEVVRSRNLSGRAELLFSPATGKLDPRNLAAWILRDRLPVRLNLQLHKYIWGATARGV